MKFNSLIHVIVFNWQTIKYVDKKILKLKNDQIYIYMNLSDIFPNEFIYILKRFFHIIKMCNSCDCAFHFLQTAYQFQITDLYNFLYKDYTIINYYLKIATSIRKKSQNDALCRLYFGHLPFYVSDLQLVQH